MTSLRPSFIYSLWELLTPNKAAWKRILNQPFMILIVFEFCSVCLILWRVENASDFNDFEANISSQWWFQLLFCWLYIKCFDLDSATFFRCGSYIFTSLMMPSKKSVILLYMITSVFDLIVTAVFFFLNIVDQQDVNCVFELLCVVGNYFSELWNL